MSSNPLVIEKLKEFLGHVDISIVCQLPDNNNKLLVAAKSRRGKNVKRITGKILLRRNVESETTNVVINNKRYLINLAVDEIWSNHLSDTQKDQFTSLADGANEINQKYISRVHINNSMTLDHIARIYHQDTEDPTQRDFYNGANFSENSETASSILSPAGFFTGSSFLQ
ncbi:4044_t:CDS:1 [Funneliformis mosseae]|uniref:4044_t:CDS:1 n=1 Tax=Funneliformis mosseae TaxID=27381 RepID=A0A9N9HLV6_FUNMO|nr:4044_t:CDS:1 [Funneliformis mosseae]